jgi:putative ABC transport system permease protein
MMAALHTTNRAMFWRIIRRLFGANRGRLFVMLLALGSGAAVTAALLNLQIDAKRRLTFEFRAFGTNVIISPKVPVAGDLVATMNDSIMDAIPKSVGPYRVEATSFLYAIASVRGPRGGVPVNAILAGKRGMGIRTVSVTMIPPPTNPDAPGYDLVVPGDLPCTLGVQVAKQLDAHVGETISILISDRKRTCKVSSLVETGGPEDSQVTVMLDFVQRLSLRLWGISDVEIMVPGTPKQIDDYVSALQKQFPDLDVRPIRQFTEAQAKIYGRISGLLEFTVALVLVLTALCVMAAMTNVAMERKMDVGLMKAIGGSMRRVLRLFLVESALLGLAGGAIGAAAGIFLSIGLGKAVFGVAARPRLIVYPVAVALTILVAIISAYPLRRLASIRPASVFRGEA